MRLSVNHKMKNYFCKFVHNKASIITILLKCYLLLPSETWIQFLSNKSCFSFFMEIVFFLIFHDILVLWIFSRHIILNACKCIFFFFYLQSLKTLKNLNWYCMSLLLQLSEDCLKRCPIFKVITTVVWRLSQQVPYI